MPRLTLKNKVTLFFPLVITVLFACLFLLIYSFLHKNIKESVSKQQYQIVSVLAADLDRSIAHNSEVLTILAKHITLEMINNPQKSLSYLKLQSEHLIAFDNGMFIFNSEGRLVAELPLGLERTGKDLSYREYFKQTVATRKPFVSDPYVSSQSHQHPVIMFTAPILDRRGTLLGIMGGSVDLSNPAFFGKFTNVKMGKSGYPFLFNSDRMMLQHPDKSRIMKYDIYPGANKLLDQALSGFDGSGETVTSRGVQVLASFKHLRVKNWILGANYPLVEVYAPVNKIRNVFLGVLPLFSLVLFLFMRLYLNRMTYPIIKLTRHVEELPTKSGAERIFQTQGEDEIATLGDAFNRLVQESDIQRNRLEENLDKLGRSDAQLQRQNGYLQALHETTLGLINRRDVAGLLQAIVIRAGNLLGTEHCYVYLKNAAGTEMEMMFQSGIYNRLRHYPIRPGEGIAGRIWSTGKLCNINDYTSWEGRLADPDRDVLHGMAGVPLKSGEEVVGVLGVVFVDEGIILNDEQLDVLVQFGELASLALENARLVDESQRELAERIKAEERLRKLYVAVEQSPASILITDTHGTIEYVNSHFTALTGYSFDEVVGKNPNILKTGETTRDEYQQLWETILAGGEWHGEFRNRKKNGDLYWEQALIAPIRDNNGTITHFIAIKEDVTERKQLESQLWHVQKMDAIGQLAGGIAHDFNNILAAIVGYAGIMRLKLPDDSSLKRNAEQIAAAAERGAALTKALLAFSREQVSHPAIVDLNEVISRVHQLLHWLISENVHIEIDLEQKGVPALVDSGEIEQVLMNLSTNARDALPSGGTIAIRTEVATIDSDFILAKGFGISGKYALITFSDNGEGMSAEVARHVFEPFYSTRAFGKGTGLGLSIVYGIIKKHNGYIVCNSTLGLGTVFQIYLPLMDPVDAVSRENVQQKVVEARTGDYILLAEDNETLRLLDRRILEEFGYSVIEAVDGEDALEKFRGHREQITLVILDVIMPKMNGRDVYDVIKSIDPKTRILFCSGCTEELMVSRGELDEGIPFLSKPFTPKELLMKIREVLDNGQ